MSEYFPPGHAGSLEALRRIARSITPRNWTNIPEDEEAVWQKLGNGLSGEHWQQHLLVCCKERSTALAERAADYMEALKVLRDNLVLDRIAALVMER